MLGCDVALSNIFRKRFKPSDLPGLQLWLDTASDQYVKDASNRCSQWGDLSGYGRHATQSTDASKPVVTRGDNFENRWKYSEDISQADWITSLGTKNSASLFTFSAQYGYLAQNVTLITGATYRITAQIRAVSGNTALHFMHPDSGTPRTAITVTGTLAEYSTTFASTISTASTIGIQDRNAAGQGQIEVTKLQICLVSAASSYVATTTLPAYSGLNGVRALLFDGVDDKMSLGATLGQLVSATGGTSCFIIRPDSTNATNRFFTDAGANWELLQNTTVLQFTHYGTNQNRQQTTVAGANVFVALHGDGAIKVWNNTVLTGPTASGDTVGLTGATKIGTRYNDTGYYSGRIGEIIFYNRALSDAEIAKLSAYAMKKWRV